MCYISVHKKRQHVTSIFRIHKETWNIWTHLLGMCVDVDPCRKVCWFDGVFFEGINWADGIHGLLCFSQFYTSSLQVSLHSLRSRPTSSRARLLRFNGRRRPSSRRSSLAPSCVSDSRSHSTQCSVTRRESDASLTSKTYQLLAGYPLMGKIISIGARSRGKSNLGFGID